MKQTVTITLVGIVFILLGFGIQTQINFSGDVRYLLFALEQLLKGGVYGQEIFETNPPMILYLYLPPFLLHHFFDLSLMTAVRLYVFMMGSISIIFCFNLMKQYIKDNYFISQWMATLFFVVFILPLHEFAQREHLFLIVLLPYLFLSVLRLEKITVHNSLACLVGFFAGFGIALKPFFLIPIFFIEILMIQKRIRYRLEFCSAMLVICFYLLSIIFFQPEYIQVMLPWVSHYYFPFAKQNLNDFFSPPYVLFCIGVTFSYLFFYSFDRLRSMGLILWVTLIGAILSFCCARTSWYYHVLPALALSYLLSVFCIGQLLSSYRTVFIAVVFVFLIPFYNHFIMFQYDIETKKLSQKLSENIPDNKTIMCLPLGTRDCFPFIDSIHAKYGSRFPSLWWFKGVSTLEKTENTSRIIRDKEFLIKKIVNDLDYNNPDFVIFNNHILSSCSIIAYLEQNKNFKKAWEKYNFKMQLDEYAIYQKIN